MRYYYVVWVWYDNLNDFPVQRFENSVIRVPPGTLGPKDWVLSQRRRFIGASWVSHEEITKEDYEKFVVILK